MVPFLELKTQYRALAEELEPVVLRILASGSYILGQEVEAFESEFARYLEAGHAVGVSSGLDALRLALLALDIGPGDEVITASNTFIATALAITSVGATPVLVDPDEATYNIEAAAIEKAITPRTRALIPVHLYGLPARMDPILDLAGRKLSVIEDACQAHGATIGGRKAGTLGDVGCFSFYPGKNLGAYGDGGMVVTQRVDLAERIRSLRNYGQEKKYHHARLGFNHRLDEIQAAILRVKLPHIDEWNRMRQGHARAYDDALSSLPVTLPVVPERHGHIFHLYVIRTDRRDELVGHLVAHGIGALMHYPIPIHRQKAYAGHELSRKSLPIADRLSREIVSLPMFPELTPVQIDEVATAIRLFFGREKR